MSDIRTHLLDTSALLKLFLKEDGSDEMREYFTEHSVFWTTSLCFAETLGVLKREYVKKKGVLSKDEYIETSAELMAYIRNGSILIEEVDVTQIEVFNETERYVDRYSLGIADALQLVTLKQGISAMLTGDSKPMLITADEGLAKAATQEGLRVWDVNKRSVK